MARREYLIERDNELDICVYTMEEWEILKDVVCVKGEGTAIYMKDNFISNSSAFHEEPLDSTDVLWTPAISSLFSVDEEGDEDFT